MKKIIVGKAASGKDYFRSHLIKMGEAVDTSHTTRPMREGEKEGYHYNFVDDQFFDEGEWFEQVEFNGYKYGTSLKNWMECDWFIMTPGGVNNINKMNQPPCQIVYFDIDMHVRRERLRLRSDYDQVERRLVADENDFRFCPQYFAPHALTYVRDPEFDPQEIFELVTKQEELWTL